MSMFLAGFFLIILSGCAQNPKDIAPAYASTVPYETWTCEQLAQETVRIDQALVTASATQTQTRSGDTIAVILIGLPLSSMSGANVAPQIAYLKGQSDAIRQVMIRKNCSTLLAHIPAPPLAATPSPGS